jgi:hypothetical protein
MSTTSVQDWFAQRIDALYQNALKGSYDFYLTPAEAAHAPAAWRGKPIYRDESGTNRLPHPHLL